MFGGGCVVIQYHIFPSKILVVVRLFMVKLLHLFTLTMENSITHEVFKDVCVIHELSLDKIGRSTHQSSNIRFVEYLAECCKNTEPCPNSRPCSVHDRQRDCPSILSQEVQERVGHEMRLGSIEKKNSLKSKWWSCYNIFSKEASQKVIFRITYLYTRLHIIR